LAYFGVEEWALELNIPMGDLEYDRIQRIIDKAHVKVLEDISVHVSDMSINTIDSSKNYYQLKHRYIADINFDRQIDDDDVTLYYWTDTSDENTKTEVSITNLNNETGWFETTESIDPSYTITADYNYYHNKMSFEDIEDAIMLWTTYKVGLNEFALMTESFTAGSLRLRHNHPYRATKQEYYNHIYGMINSPIGVRIPSPPFTTNINRLTWSE